MDIISMFMVPISSYAWLGRTAKHNSHSARTSGFPTPIPTTAHNRPPRALAVAPWEGNPLLASGGADGSLSLWDWDAMDAGLLPLRTQSVGEGHSIASLAFHPSLPFLLVASGDPAIALMDGAGTSLASSVTGDPYVRDQRLTLGHTGGITQALWAGDKVLSGSLDGTARLWDIAHLGDGGGGESPKWDQSLIMRPKSNTGGRLVVSRVAWDASNPDLYYTACGDQTLQIFDGRKNLAKPAGLVQNKMHGAHTPHMAARPVSSRPASGSASIPSGETTDMAVSGDGILLVARSSDHTVRIWDVRSMDRPIKVYFNLPSAGSGSSIAFSPHNALISTVTDVGTSGPARIVMIDTVTLDVVHQEPLSSSTGAVSIAYAQDINQIFVGMADGALLALYSDEFSKAGVKSGAHAKARTRDASDTLQFQPEILDPANIRFLSRKRSLTAAHKASSSAPGPSQPPVKRHKGL